MIRLGVCGGLCLLGCVRIGMLYAGLPTEIAIFPEPTLFKKQNFVCGVLQCFANILSTEGGLFSGP